jgi:NAD(P)H-hydrate epimerase
VCLAVYLHGLAGDLAVETLGEECLTARDLIAFLPRAWAALRSGPDD